MPPPAPAELAVTRRASIEQWRRESIGASLLFGGQTDSVEEVPPFDLDTQNDDFYTSSWCGSSSTSPFVDNFAFPSRTIDDEVPRPPIFFTADELVSAWSESSCDGSEGGFDTDRESACSGKSRSSLRSAFSGFIMSLV